MRYRLYILVGLLFVILLTGCFNDNEAAEELIDYHNNDWLIFFSIKQEEISPLISDLFFLAIEDDEQGIEKLLKEDMMPTMREAANYLKEIDLENEELQELNQLLIDAEKYNYDKYQELSEVISKGEEEEIDTILGEFEQHTKEYENRVNEFNKRRDELMKKYNVIWNEDEDESINGQKVMTHK